MLRLEFFFIREFNDNQIALFYLPIFPHHATPKLSELLYKDIVYTLHLEVIRAS